MSVDPGAVKIRGRQQVLSLITDSLVAIFQPVAPTRAPEYARMLFGALKSLAHWRVERNEPLSGDAHLLVSTFLQGMACV
jgi:hypothetical protein